MTQESRVSSESFVTSNLQFEKVFQPAVQEAQDEGHEIVLVATSLNSNGVSAQIVKYEAPNSGSFNRYGNIVGRRRSLYLRRCAQAISKLDKIISTNGHHPLVPVHVKVEE